MDFMRALRVLKARKFVAISMAVLAFVVVIMAPTPQADVRPIYTSRAKLLITPPNSSVRAYGGQAGVSVDFSWFSDPVVLEELLRSDELLDRVVEQAHSNIDKARLSSAISVEPLSRGGMVRLFNLAIADPNPLEAQKLDRLVTNEFVKYVEDLSAREFANTRRFIEELVAEAEGRRDAAETALMTVREKYLKTESEQEIDLKVSDLQTRLNDSEREISSLTAEATSLNDYLTGASSNPPWAVIEKGDGSLGTLDANVAEKRMELVRLREIYTDKNDNVVRAERLLANAEKLYQQAVSESAASLYKEKSSLLAATKASRNSLIAEINGLLRSRMSEDDKRQVAKHERELQVWEQNALNLQQQLYQARVVEQSSRRSGAVSILEPPSVGAVTSEPTAKVSKSAMKRALMSIPFCLILGIAAAFAQEYLSSSTKLRPQVEEALELPVLAVIPATPSELTVDWESFKRPGQRESIKPLVLTGQPGSRFQNRNGEQDEAPVSGDNTESSGENSSSFGGNFRFRNQK